MQDHERVRLALLGPGGFGWERARAMKASSLVDFVACYSPIESENIACQKAFGAQALGSDAMIWNDPEIEGVVVSTPNPLHLEQTRLASASGKHVFVEKPMAPNVADARKMIEVCEKAGVLLMVGHNARRRERIRLMKNYLDDSRLGQVLAAETNNSHAGGYDIQMGDWRWFPANCPGGPLSQLGVHHTDTLQYLLGPVERVLAWQRHLTISAAIDDITMTLLEFKSGAIGYIGAFYAVPDLRFVHVLGSKANMRWDRAMGLVFEDGSGQEFIPVADNDTVQEEIDEFARCIRFGSKPEVDGHGGLQALAVIEAAVLSNQRGCPVEMNELLG